MSAYETIIGLEVHVQLNTATKIFCSCATTWAKTKQKCLPHLLGTAGWIACAKSQSGKKGVTWHSNQCYENQPKPAVLRVKTTFYPDLPKAYQISQFEDRNRGAWGD